MSTSTEHEETAESADYAGIGTAELSLNVAETADGEPYVIHGVALGSGDITRTEDGDKKLWTAEALESGAETLEGRPLVKNHTNDADGRIGTVVQASYQPGVGVIYEAEIAPHYEELAKDVQADIQEVSVRALHPDTEELSRDEDTGALRIDYVVFDNLSIVHKGEAPSNTAEPGPSPFLSPDSGAEAVARTTAQASETDEPGGVAVLSREVDIPDSGTVAELLSAQSGSSVATDGEQSGSETSIDGDSEPTPEEPAEADEADEADETTEAAETDEVDTADEDLEADEVDTADEDLEADELKSAAGVSFQGTTSGKLDESSIPDDDYASHYLFDGDTKSESSYPVVDADGQLRRGNVESAFELGARGGVSESTLHEKLRALNDEFENSPIDPEKLSEVTEAEEQAEQSGSPDTNADGPTESPTRSVDIAQLADHSSSTTGSSLLVVTTQSTTHTMSNIEYEDASEDAIEEMDDPVVVEKNEVESLSEKADRADELDEKLDDVNSSLEELAEDRETLEQVDESQVEELAESDDPVVVESEELEAKDTLVEETGEIYAEELESYSPFSAEELMDRFDPAELREKVDEHDEAELAATVDEEPEPEGETVEEEELSESETEAERDELEEQAREKVAEDLEDAGWDRQAEKVREGEMALDELGVDISAD